MPPVDSTASCRQFRIYAHPEALYSLKHLHQADSQALENPPLLLLPLPHSA